MKRRKGAKELDEKNCPLNERTKQDLVLNEFGYLSSGRIGPWTSLAPKSAQTFHNVGLAFARIACLYWYLKTNSSFGGFGRVR